MGYFSSKYLQRPICMFQILLLFYGFICLSSNLFAVAENVDGGFSQQFSKYQVIQPKITIVPDVTYQNQQLHYRAKRHIDNGNSQQQKENSHFRHASQITLELPLKLEEGDYEDEPSSLFHGGGYSQQIKPQQQQIVEIQLAKQQKKKKNENHKVYILDLQLNKDLIPDGYFIRSQNNGQPVISKPSSNDLESEHCHYHGKIRGRINSWAALSLCNGLRGVVFDGHELHYLEPSNTTSASGNKTDDKNKLNTLHFKDSDRKTNLTCGHSAHDTTNFPFQSPHTDEEEHVRAHRNYMEENHVHNENSDKHARARVKRAASDSSSSYDLPYNSNAKSRYVELILVVDNKKFKELNSNMDKTLQRTKEIANIVNVLYSPLNIFIALVGVVVWNEVDEITLSKKGDETLASFLRYRRERLLKDHPNDNAQLLTAMEFEDGVVGKAMQGPICSFKYSGGVNSDHGIIGVVATTVAHELGHNFGLSHDTETCKCDGPNSKCIMSASSSSNRTAHWSSCSLDAMNYAFKHGMDYCLRNKPRTLFKGPTCGNGYTEPGEECDCGLPEKCTNPCCNANTCKLHSNATCGSGQCCDFSVCHPKAGGTICRAPKSQCDLPEYCNGDHHICPADVFKQNGQECETSNGLAQCFEGECRTHTDQCRLLWGPTGETSMDICYQKNVNGSRYGHCGYDLEKEKYSKCAREDIKCGVLQCHHQEEKLQFGYEQVAILSTFFLNTGGKVHPCRSVTTDFGLSDADPGLAPNGARCGDDKMCLNQKCVPIATVRAPFNCPENCNGHGVCNSKGHCHCDEGFGGDSCDSGGFGGSVDSGPVLNPYSSASIFAKALYVTFLGFIPLIAVISFYLYYAGDNLKKLCKQGQFVTRIQNRGKPPYQNGSGGGSSHGGHGEPTTVSTNAPPNSSSIGSMNTAADDFFGQYKGFSLSPARNTTAGGAANGDVRNHTTTVVQNGNANAVQNYYSSIPSSPKSQAPCPPATPASAHQIQTQVLLKNEKPSLKENFLQKGITRVSWAHPIAHTTPISPEEDRSCSNDDDSANNSDTPLYENSSTAAAALRSPQKTRPLSSPDALNDSKLFATGQENNSSSPQTKKDSSSFFGGSTSALSRLASAFPFVRNSFMKNSTSIESTTNHSSVNNLPSNTKGGIGIQRQRSFNRDSLQISQPILHNPNEIESKIHGNFVSLAPTTGNRDLDVVDSGPRYANLPATKDGLRYSNVPTTEEMTSPAVKPASPKFIGRSAVAKPFSKNLVRLKGEVSDNSAPSPQQQSPSPTTTKSASPPPGPQQQQPASKPTVMRAQSMTQPNRTNRNSVGSNPNYNSLRRTSRPSVPPPKPPEPTTTAAKTSSSPSIFQPLPALPKPNEKSCSPPTALKNHQPPLLKYTIGGRFTSRNDTFNKPLFTTSKKPTTITTSNTCFAPLAKIDDMNSPSSSSTSSAAGIKPACSSSLPPAANASAAENIYDVIDEGEREKTIAEIEEKIETLSTGSSENGGGLLSEIISEISSRNRDSIYNSMDRRKLRREKKKTENAQKAATAAESSKVNTTGKQQPLEAMRLADPAGSSLSTKIETDKFNSSRERESSKSPVSSTPTTTTNTTPSTRITINPGFEKINKPASPKSAYRKITPPANTISSIRSQPSISSSPPASISSLSRSIVPTLSSGPCSIISASPATPVTSTSAFTPPTVPPQAPSTLSPSTSTAKPTCAVNGIPKMTSSPSYVAKINYFTNLGSNSLLKNNDPLNNNKLVTMKPMNSLTLSQSPRSSILAPQEEDSKEVIYAPGQLSTIRRSRGSNKSYLNNVDSSGSADDSSSTSIINNNKPMTNGTSGNSTGVYCKPVAVPTVPMHNGINNSSSNTGSLKKNAINNSNATTNLLNSVDIVSATATESNKEPDQILSGVGYKSFHPYLNRPLTFSTFRPSSGLGGKDNTSSALAANTNSTTTTLTPGLKLNSNATTVTAIPSPSFVRA